MTTAECLVSAYPSFETRVMTARKMYETYLAHYKSFGFVTDPADAFAFLLGGYTRYLWKKDELVTANGLNGICIVTGWTTSGDHVLVKDPSGRQQSVLAEDLRKADIPPDILRLAIGRVSASCPLCKEAPGE